MKPVPKGIRPMLATPGEPFDSGEYRFEIKWDGIRAIAYKDHGAFWIETRQLIPALPRFPELASVARRIRSSQAVLDGEIVVPGDDGRPDFDAARARSAQGSARAILQAQREHPALFVAFDCLFLDGEELFAAPLSHRIERLWEACEPTEPLLLSKGVVGAGTALFQQVSAQGLEGIVAKRLDSPYLPGERSVHWIKVRAVRRADCVVGGFVPKGERHLKSLLLGLYDADRLVYVGRVGTGFSLEENRSIRAALESLRAPDPPFAATPREAAKEAVWVLPRLVACVEYLTLTGAGHLRHPSFKGLRTDKEPSSCSVASELHGAPSAGGALRG